VRTIPLLCALVLLVPIATAYVGLPASDGPPTTRDDLPLPEAIATSTSTSTPTPTPMPPPTVTKTPSPVPDPGLVAPATDGPMGREQVRHLQRATSINDADGNKIFDDLDRLYLSSPPGTRLPVIVTGIHTTSADHLLEETEKTIGRDLEEVRLFRYLPAILVSLSHTEALQVASLDLVRQLEHNRAGQPELDTATLYSGARAVVEQLGITGDGDDDPGNFTSRDINIAVLDTGIDGRHVDFQDGKIVASYDAGRESYVDPIDTGTHGTHVASIAAGLGRGDPDHMGVAPGSGIINIQISGTEGSTADNVLHAVEWAIENKDTYNIRVLTMSFGFGQATDGTTAMELAFDKAWDAGIVTFKSAGNSGPERTTITVPGAARGIISVGAMLDPSGIPGSLPAEIPSDLEDGLGMYLNQAGFVLAPFSSRGPTTDGRVKPDLVAPGWSITAAHAGTRSGYATFSGTSMAAPFAAGVAALVIAADASLTPDEVRGILRGSSEDWGVEGADIDYGWGRVDALSAVVWSLVQAGAEPPEVEPPLIPRHEVRMGRVDETGTSIHEIVIEDPEAAFGLTFISESRAVSLQIQKDSQPVTEGIVHSLDLSRQIQRGALSAVEGTYTVVLQSTPGAAYSLDVAHSTKVRAPLTVFDAERFQALSEPEQPAASVPAPAVLWGILAILGALALKRRGPAEDRRGECLQD
jgi:hypothetical protein